MVTVSRLNILNMVVAGLEDGTSKMECSFVKIRNESSQLKNL